MQQPTFLLFLFLILLILYMGISFDKDEFICIFILKLTNYK